MIDKKNIKKYVGCALVATIITGGVVAKGVEVERNVDHVHELCPFVSVLGLEHQANAINNNNYFYQAVYTNSKSADTRPDTYLYDSQSKEFEKVEGIMSETPDYINKNGEEAYKVPYPYTTTGAIHKGESDGTETVTVYRSDPSAIMEGIYNILEKERTFEKDEDGIDVVEHYEKEESGRTR